MGNVRVSICLPTYNGASDLGQLLPRLREQRLDGVKAWDEGLVEVLAVDSSSSDDTRGLLAAHGVDFEVIPKAQFRHGATRNRIARRARGSVLVFLSQDALPMGSDFVEQMCSAFEDPRTAGASARVVPHDEDDPLTRRTVLALPEARPQETSAELAPGEDLWSLSCARRGELLVFNDVASAIRAEVFREIPFPDLDFGEDVAWAARALSAGWRLRFASRAVVAHAHRYSPRQAFERYRIDARFRRQVLGQVVRPSLLSVLRGIGYEVREDLRYLSRDPHAAKLRALALSPLLRGAQVVGQYVGAHGPMSGREESSLSGQGR